MPNWPTNVAIRRAIYGKLAGGMGTVTYPTGGTAALAWKTTGQSIYYQVADENAPLPFIVFSKQSGMETGPFRGFAGTTEHDMWMVKVVDQNTTADRVEMLADRARYLLNGSTSSGGIAGSSISGTATPIYLRRESDIDYAEVVNGDVYHHCGSLYRVIVDFS